MLIVLPFDVYFVTTSDLFVKTRFKVNSLRLRFEGNIRIQIQESKKDFAIFVK